MDNPPEMPSLKQLLDDGLSKIDYVTLNRYEKVCSYVDDSRERILADHEDDLFKREVDRVMKAKNKNRKDAEMLVERPSFPRPPPLTIKELISNRTIHINTRTPKEPSEVYRNYFGEYLDGNMALEDIKEMAKSERNERFGRRDNCMSKMTIFPQNVGS